MMNINLDRMEQYLNDNELIINSSKTHILECMIHQKKGRTKGDPPHLVVPDPKNPGQMVNITDKTSIRILGSNIQSNMNWDSHLTGGDRAILPAQEKTGILETTWKETTNGKQETTSKWITD